MNNLQKYFPFTLNPDQEKATSALVEFIGDNVYDVFILSGYAGTGKTTILKGILDFLDEIEKPYGLWASTGRAAKVLGTITSRKTKTIHSAIYMLDENSSKLDEDNKQLSFKLKPNYDKEETIYFVDEASMIADKAEDNPYLLFENGRLLDHLFQYFDNRKVVFIGDAAQLPPINCTFSAALDESYLKRIYGKHCKSVLLTEVMRQQLESGILWNATQIRQLNRNTFPPPMGIKTSGFDDIKIARNVWNALDDFVDTMNEKGTGYAAFISFSNGGIHYLNQQIRNKYYAAKDPPLQNGDFLMVIQNNYLHDLVNGQHVKLLHFDPEPIRQHSLHFINATIEIPETGKNKEIYILKELLERKEPSLTQAEENEIMKNFVMRMKHYGVKPKTDEYFRRFITDPFVNALRVKYGYAVTCHKAQGGEWPKVYVNFEPMLENIPRQNLYRWTYTAITRASRELVFPYHKYLY